MPILLQPSQEDVQPAAFSFCRSRRHVFCAQRKQCLSFRRRPERSDALWSKGGVRHEKLGYFVRVRPGFQTFTRAVSSIDPNTLVFKTANKTHPALDLGGGVEFFPSRRTVVRFDAGDTLLFLGPASIPFGTQAVTNSAGTRNSFQFSTSFGWSF